MSEKVPQFTASEIEGIAGNKQRQLISATGDHFVCHVKVEAEKSSSLMQKGGDPIVPHVEIDLTYSSRIVTVQAEGQVTVPSCGGDETVAYHQGNIQRLLHAANVEARTALQVMVLNLDVDSLRRG